MNTEFYWNIQIPLCVCVDMAVEAHQIKITRDLDHLVSIEICMHKYTLQQNKNMVEAGKTFNWLPNFTMQTKRKEKKDSAIRQIQLNSTLK